MELPAIFERYRAEIAAELRAALDGYTLPMYDMLRYHLGWIDEDGTPLPGSAGKALRPTLCLLACEAAGGAYHKVLPAAAALELLHNYSLIHDDVQDGDRERRHRPSVWAIWGKPQAINAGSAMRSLASLSLLRLAHHGAPAPKLLRALRLLDESCLRLIEGQYLDISFETRLDVRVSDYLEMIDGKTAALLAGSLEMGAMLASDNEQIVAACRDFGRNLGLAFQVRDDLLGIWGEEARTGKPIGSDIRRRKKSLPIVYALEKATGRAKAEMVSAYQAPYIDDRKVQMVLDILAGTGARARAQHLVDEYTARALEAIARTPLDPWASGQFVEIARFLGGRDF